jgi:hypothetical protein
MNKKGLGMEKYNADNLTVENFGIDESGVSVITVSLPDGRKVHVTWHPVGEVTVFILDANMATLHIEGMENP